MVRIDTIRLTKPAKKLGIIATIVAKNRLDTALFERLPQAL